VGLAPPEQLHESPVVPATHTVACDLVHTPHLTTPLRSPLPVWILVYPCPELLTHLNTVARLHSAVGGQVRRTLLQRGGLAALLHHLGTLHGIGAGAGTPGKPAPKAKKAARKGLGRGGFAKGTGYSGGHEAIGLSAKALYTNEVCVPAPSPMGTVSCKGGRAVLAVITPSVPRRELLVGAVCRATIIKLCHRPKHTHTPLLPPHPNHPSYPLARTGHSPTECVQS
jgi:hypothetical protein